MGKSVAKQVKTGRKAAGNKPTRKKSARKKAARKKAAPKKVARKKAARKKPATRKSAAQKPVRLLSGGNPQIAKADGDAPVRAFIEAMPGWKREVGRRLDALIVKSVPGVKKAVKWNSPLYGVPGGGWFLGFHCVTKYVKVAFFNGGSLEPKPPVESKDPKTRYLHIHEGEPIDEKQLKRWLSQASKLPGWFAAGP